MTIMAARIVKSYLKIRTNVYHLINNVLIRYKLSLSIYSSPSIEGRLLKLISRVRRENNLLMTIQEGIQLHRCAQSVLKLRGDFAEVGVYMGGSAKIMADVKGKKRLYLFDNFDEGLPEPQSILDADLKKGQQKTALKEVKKTLKDYKNIYFYKGVFPKSTKRVRSKCFSLVHLDVDLYQSTKDCLNFFYPRMVRGGIILTHDYPFKAVKTAFDDFFLSKPEYIIRLADTQAMVIKM